MMKLQKPSNATVGVDSTSTLVLAANDRRKHAIITNSSDVGVWLAFGEAAQVGYGVYLASAGGSYQIDEGNLFVGVIYGISASGDDKVVGTLEFS